MVDADAAPRPLTSDFRGDAVEDLHRQRRVRLVLEIAHAPALVGGAHDPDECANGAAAFAVVTSGLFDRGGQRARPPAARS